jgi:hypothetical protein
MEDMTGLTREEREEFANRASDDEEGEDSDQYLAALEEKYFKWRMEVSVHHDYPDEEGDDTFPNTVIIYLES